MKGGLGRRADRGRAGRLWTAVYVLMGLGYEQAFVETLLQGVMGMKESATYQAILAEGKADIAEGAREELRKMLLTLGQEQFGEPGQNAPEKKPARRLAFALRSGYAKLLPRVFTCKVKRFPIHG